MPGSVIERVWELAEPLVAHEGLEIVDIEYRREGRGMMLRLYLDRAGGVGGVTLDELASANRQLGDLLEVHDAVAGSYLLEVSSPGVDRRLRKAEQFQRYLGKTIRVRVTVPRAGRRNFLGSLKEVASDGITVTEDDGDHFVPFTDIAQANYESERK